MIKWPEPVAYRVNGGKRNEQLLQPYEYQFELVVPKVMCKPLVTLESAKQAVRDAYEDALKACRSQSGIGASHCSDAIRTLIKEI